MMHQKKSRKVRRKRRAIETLFLLGYNGDHIALAYLEQLVIEKFAIDYGRKYCNITKSIDIELIILMDGRVKLIS